MWTRCVGAAGTNITFLYAFDPNDVSANWCGSSQVPLCTYDEEAGTGAGTCSRAGADAGARSCAGAEWCCLLAAFCEFFMFCLFCLALSACSCLNRFASITACFLAAFCACLPHSAAGYRLHCVRHTPLAGTHTASPTRGTVSTKQHPPTAQATACTHARVPLPNLSRPAVFLQDPFLQPARAASVSLPRQPCLWPTPAAHEHCTIILGRPAYCIACVCSVSESCVCAVLTKQRVREAFVLGQFKQAELAFLSFASCSSCARFASLDWPSAIALLVRDARLILNSMNRTLLDDAAMEKMEKASNPSNCPSPSSPIFNTDVAHLSSSKAQVKLPCCYSQPRLQYVSVCCHPR